MRRLLLIALVLGACVSLQAQATKVISSTALPASCSNGAVYVKTSTSAGWYVCFDSGSGPTWVGPYPTTAGGTVTHTGTLTSGVLLQGNGGADIKTFAVTDDTVPVGNGTTTDAKTLPNCVDTGGNHLNYTQSSNTFSCGNSGASGIGSTVAMASAYIATDETTNSTTYADLATTGPSVTVSTTTAATVIVSSGCTYKTTTGNTAFISVAVSGASTVAAADGAAGASTAPLASSCMGSQAVLSFTGLTAGSNTFTVKYRVDGGTFHFVNRGIFVISQ